MTVSVRRPKAIVFDILGTASKSGFLERILFPFLKMNLDAYITTHWTKKDFIKLYNKIMEQSVEFNKQEPSTPIVLAHDTSQGKASLMNFINFVTDNGINSPAVTQLRFKVWFEGYQQSKLRTPIYSDVPAQIRKWFAEGIKFYVFSNTWVEAQKALLKNTNHGDMTNLISGHYDNDFGSLTESDSWRRLCTEIHEHPNEVLFLTKSPLEGRAAADAGLAVVLVLTHRHNVKAVSHEDRQRFPFVRTLHDLTWIEGSMMPGSELPSGHTTNEIQGPIATAVSATQGTSPNGILAAPSGSASTKNHELSTTQSQRPSTATTVSGHSKAQSSQQTSKGGSSMRSQTSKPPSPTSG